MRCFRILLPTYQPGGLKAKIYPHWKDAPSFTIVCFDGEKVLEEKSVSLGSDELIINLVKKENIKYVIAMSLSTRALELLTKQGVVVLTGNISTVQDALEKFKEKKLFKLKLVKERQV